MHDTTVFSVEEDMYWSGLQEKTFECKLLTIYVWLEAVWLESKEN